MDDFIHFDFEQANVDHRARIFERDSSYRSGYKHGYVAQAATYTVATCLEALNSDTLLPDQRQELAGRVNAQLRMYSERLTEMLLGENKQRIGQYVAGQAAGKLAAQELYDLWMRHLNSMYHEVASVRHRA